jgi:hypothetical protein
MSEIVISVEGISKYYRLGERDRYRMFRDALVRSLSNQMRKIRSRFGERDSPSNGNENMNDFWALKDISFEVKEGRPGHAGQQHGMNDEIDQAGGAADQDRIEHGAADQDLACNRGPTPPPAGRAGG